MKVSELIQSLQSILENKGDLDVLNSHGTSIGGVVADEVEVLFNVEAEDWGFEKHEECCVIKHDV